MKTRILILLAALFFSAPAVKAAGDSLGLAGDNLDLAGVLELFKKALLSFNKFPRLFLKL